MCGIVGFVGKEKNASKILLDCLVQLEYRGYDSAGIAVLDEKGEVQVRKCKGRLTNLIKKVEEFPVVGSCGIGHTRWATHGEPNDVNSHPHINVSGDIAIVHNGIVENYQDLHLWLEKKGIVFRSQTDSECIAHLVSYYYKGDLLEAVRKTTKQIVGSFALAVVCKNQNQKIVVARKDAPLVIGRGQGLNLIASDVTPLLAYTREVQYLENNQIAEITDNEVKIYLDDEEVNLEIKHVDWDYKSAQKNGYEHFMLKEIFEQPFALDQTYKARVYGGKLDLGEIKELADKCERIIIIGCGSAYHVGMIGKYAIEHFARIPVIVDIASEFRYRNPILKPTDLCLVISQSGETSDTLQGLRLMKEKGLKTVAITNVIGSTISREADIVMYTYAGPEIAVATTKALTTQIMCLYQICISLIKDSNQLKMLLKELSKLGSLASKVLEEQIKPIQKFASRQYNKSKVFYLGRQIDYAVSLESALKLKEINYTHSEAFPGGELKHGPIALVDEDTLVIATCCQSELYDKMDSNIKEVKARGAVCLVITFEGNHRFDNIVEQVFRVPKTNPYFSPVLTVIITQTYAYYCSILRGLDPDKPRNLAKSVTVE